MGEKNSYPIKEFKQCPFCGRIWMTVEADKNQQYAVHCMCGTSGPRHGTRKKAIAAWNTRDQHLFWNPFRLSIRFRDTSRSVDFRGRLDSVDLATVLQMLASREKTGILQLGKGYLKSAICLSNGNIIAASDSNGLRIGQLLYSNGLISRDHLKDALKTAKKSGKMLGEVLLSLNYVEEETLNRVIQQQVQETVLELFFWREGTFEYRDCILDFDHASIQELNTMEVIMESARRLDEWDELKKNQKIAPMIPKRLTNKPVTGAD